MATAPTDTNLKDESELIRLLKTLVASKTIETIPVDPKDTAVESTSQGPEIKNTIKVSQDIDITKDVRPDPLITIKDRLISPYSRFPLLPIPKPIASTYTPTSWNLSFYIHYMDECIGDSISFINTGVIWHPFISRLYFSALFYLQTFRAMIASNTGDKNYFPWMRELLQMYPPESLPIPGPLMPVYKTLAYSHPNDLTYGLICPLVTNHPGPATAEDLTPVISDYYALPNMPFLLGLTNSIIEADADNVPNYSLNGSITPQEDVTINGVDFHGEWDQSKRDVLLSPCAIFRPECKRIFDLRLNRLGHNLDLPVFDLNTPIHDVTEWTSLATTNWLKHVIPTMAIYCRYWKDSGNLGQCSPSGPTSNLVRTRHLRLTSQTVAQNVVNVLNSGFPAVYPFTMSYDSRSYEPSLPDIYQQMGQLASTNASFDFRGLAHWRVNTVDHGRTGPYWRQEPSLIRCETTTIVEAVQKIISIDYFVPEPQ